MDDSVHNDEVDDKEEERDLISMRHKLHLRNYKTHNKA